MPGNANVIVEAGIALQLQAATHVVPQAICYGVYLVLMAFLISTMREPGFLKCKSNIFLMVVTVLMFLGGTLYLILDVADLLRRIDIFALGESSLKNNAESMRQTTPMIYRIEEILFVFMLSLGDSIVIWRTRTICINYRPWVLVPMTTGVAAALSGIFEMGCDIGTHWAIISGSSTGVAALCLHADMTSFSLSLVTNLMCTALVALETWSYRTLILNHLKRTKKEGQIERLLVLFVESGLIYSGFYIVQAISIYATRPPSPTEVLLCNLFIGIFQQVVGIYPTLIIILVRRRKSTWDTTELGDRHLNTDITSAGFSTIWNSHFTPNQPILP